MGPKPRSPRHPPATKILESQGRALPPTPKFGNEALSMCLPNRCRPPTQCSGSIAERGANHYQL